MSNCAICFQKCETDFSYREVSTFHGFITEYTHDACLENCVRCAVCKQLVNKSVAIVAEEFPQIDGFFYREASYNYRCPPCNYVVCECGTVRESMANGRLVCVSCDCPICFRDLEEDCKCE